MLSPEERRTLIKLGMEKTAKVYKEAEDIAKLGYWNLTGNRLYYAVFHMARTLLLDKGIEAHTHAGVIHLIGKYFIATGLLDKSYAANYSPDCTNYVKLATTTTGSTQQKRRFNHILAKSRLLSKT